jgi:hypothetical protein
MTASTDAPVSSACRSAQNRAAFDEGEPSTPTTMHRIEFSCSWLNDVAPSGVLF